MNRAIITRLFLLTLVFCLIQGFGCSSLKKASTKIIPEGGPVIKKKVLVSQIINLAGVGSVSIERSTAILSSLLKEEDEIIVHITDEYEPSDKDIRSHQTKIILDPGLIEKADKMGMNVLITAVLNPLDTFSKKMGVWGFRKYEKVTEISMIINVFDISTNTLYSSNYASTNVVIEGDQSEDPMNQREIDENILNQAIIRILDEEIPIIMETIRKRPWAGRLILTEDNHIMINGGRDIGLTEDIIFEVFAKGESIRSLRGSELPVLGPKIGEIKVINVTNDRSSAIILTGEKFKTGQMIRVKS